MFEIYFLIVIFLILYSLLLLLFHRIYNILNWINPTVLFVVNYTTFAGIGFAIFPYYQTTVNPTLALAILTGLLLFIIGSIAYDIIANPSGRIKVVHSLDISTTYTFREIVWAWIFLLLGCCTICYYYYDIGMIPLLSEDAESVRITAKAGRGYLVIVGFALLYVSTIVLIGAYTKKCRTCLYIMIFVVLSIAFLLSGIGYRSLSIRILLSGLIVYSFVKNSKMSVKILLSIAIITVSLLIMFGSYRRFGHLINSPDQASFMLYISVYTVFVRYLTVLNLILDYFPGAHPFMLGQSYLISANVIMPGAQEHFGFWLVEQLRLVLSTPGAVDPTIVGEFYANFGWVGIAIGMLILGAGLQSLNYYFKIKSPLSINKLILMTILSTSLMNTSTSGLVLVVLLDTLPLLVVFATYRFCSRLTLAISKPSNPSS